MTAPAPGLSLSTAVELRDVVKQYPTRELPALAGVSFSVSVGELVALMGPSGSGKSTMLNLIGALDSPSAGSIDVFGRSLAGASDNELTAFRRNTVGFVFQTFHLIPALTAVENVMTPMVADRGLRGRAERAVEALDAVGLAGKSRSLPGELSGGEQQRVAIARALVMQPRLLLADEPTGNLDARTGAAILDLIEAVRSERDMTVLLATHDIAVARRADRVGALADGALTADVYVRREDTNETLAARIAGATGA